MTVSTTTSLISYQGNSATTVFSYPFYVLDEEDLIVTLQDYTSGEVTHTYISGEYTVTGIGSADGGTVTLLGTPITSDSRLVLKRLVAYDQPLDLLNQSGFYPDTVEAEFDHKEMEIQQLVALYERAVVVPEGEDGMVLPGLASLIGMYLAVDADGNFVGAAGTGADLALRADLAALTGASLVGFAHADTGAVSRSVRTKLREFVSITDFGAVGDGSTDDTAAIQAALTTGKDVYITPTSSYYKISSRLTTAANGQKVYGDGLKSKIVQTGINIDGNVISFAHTDCEFYGLHLVPAVVTLTSLAHGWGLIGINADRALIHHNRVTGARRGGVALYNSDNCIVSNNIFTDSVVVGDGTEPQSYMGYDILVAETSSYNVIEGNICISGCGAGIACQTVLGTGIAQRGNLIKGNIVKDHPAYGIMLYLSGADTLVAHNIVEGNLVQDISGSVFTTGTSLFYGAGIYIQTSAGFICSNNRVFGTNTDRSLPRSGSDVPAAIAISGTGIGTVIGNNILQCYHGIMNTQTSVTGGNRDGVQIVGNFIDGVDFDGILCIDSINVGIHGNRVNGSVTADNGIKIQKLTSVQMGCANITGNDVADFPNGIIALDAPPEVLVQGNTIREATTFGIYTTAVKSVIVGNDIDAATGITTSAVVTRAVIADNIMQATTAISLGSTAALCRNNKFSAGASEGTATLVAGTVTINTVEVRSGDKIMLQRRDVGAAPGHLSINTITDATSFVVVSSEGADNGIIYWWLVH